jgi:hypothetical protein
VSEKKPEIGAEMKTPVRSRLLSDDHFEFRDGDDLMHPQPKGQPMRQCRQARLRPEYAQVYPCLIPNIWEQAAVVVEKVIAWRLQQRRGLSHRDRVLNPSHFEFRELTWASGKAHPGKAGSAG